ncbi:MAG: pre-peptidase C-terminal domain-containing protein [Planctomycetota bacterium]|jgi:hypothetical protein
MLSRTTVACVITIGGVGLLVTTVAWGQAVIQVDAELIAGNGQPDPPTAERPVPDDPRPPGSPAATSPDGLITNLDPQSDGRVSLEPNDTLLTAVDTGLAGDGTVIVIGAYIGNGDFPERDVDLYRFEVPAGAPLPKFLSVQAEGDPGALDGYLRVFDADGQELANNDDESYPNLNPFLHSYLLVAGAYYVGVSAAGNAYYDPAEPDSGMDNPTEGAYDMFITVESADPPVSVLEPNDDFATATDTGGGPYEALGEFIGDGTEGCLDIDVYHIALTGPAIIQAEVRVEQLDAVLDPVLSLRSINGTLAVNDNADFDTRDAHIQAAVFAAGDYYVIVSGAGNYLPVFDPTLRAPGSVGYYDLSIDVAPLSNPGGPLESNDSILEAAPVGLSGPGQVTLAAEVGDGPFAASRGDVDFFEIEAGNGELLTVDVDAAPAGSDLDSLVVVFDYLGQVLGASDNDGTTTDSYLTVGARKPTPDAPATLYVVVLGTRQFRPPNPLAPFPAYSEQEPNLSEHMVVEQSPSTGPYEVTFILDPVPPHDCCEPHPTPGCSNPAIEACVCAVEPDCCTDEWDTWCVELVTDPWYECGVCPSGSSRDSRGTSPPRAAPPPPSQPGSRRLFGSELGFPGNSGVEIDPADGSLVNALDIPEQLVAPGQGLAVFHDDLFYMGAGRFPRLYWLDPDTGDVFQEMFLWSGSGYYGDIAVLNSRLYLSDLLGNSIHELDLYTLQAVHTIDVGEANGIAISGALASLAHPDRLYVADAFDAGAIHAIDPATGLLDASMSAGAPCPCNADFDGDGDVDALDGLFFDDCDMGDGSVRFDCQQIDLDCDGDRDSDDEAILDCQYNGPGLPPNEECCPPGLSPVPIRATALGGSGSTRLYINDWRRDSIEVYDRTGTLLYVWPMAAPFGAIGGQPFFVYGDADDDGDVDLLDYALFTDCLTGPGGGPVLSTCRVFDAEPDDDVDLDDFAALQTAFTQEP